MEAVVCDVLSVGKHIKDPWLLIRERVAYVVAAGNFVAWMKVAVAVAIIRTKPSDKTGQEYAENLAHLYQQTQHRWKSKYEKAEEEILHLKQQMLLTNSQGTATQLSNSDIVESPSLFPTPPCSGEANQAKSMQTLSHDELHKTTTFLQSVINIQRTTNQLSQGRELHSVLSKTLYHCITVIRDMLLVNRPLVSTTNMKWSVQCIVDLMDSSRFSQDGELKMCVTALVEDLVHKIMSTNGLDTESLHIKETLESLVICFAGTTSFNFLSDILDNLVKEVEAFCNTLRHGCSGNKTTYLEQYENLYYIISALEKSLHNYHKLLSSPCGILKCQEIQERLDSALLHITELYPLVAHALWRIGTILQTTIKPV